jgi:hypothetical protein
MSFDRMIVLPSTDLELMFRIFGTDRSLQRQGGGQALASIISHWLIREDYPQIETDVD